MNLFQVETYKKRRAQLREKMGSGIILITGNTESPMNYTDNIYRFKQDSNFRYFFGINLPNLHAIIDCDSGEEIIFGNEYTLEDTIWIGAHASLRELGEKVGIGMIKPLASLESHLTTKEAVHFLPPYRHDNMILLSKFLNIDTDNLQSKASSSLIMAVVNIRSYKTAEEIVQMEDAVNITRKMHLAAMKATKAGRYEYEVVAAIRERLHAQNAELSYPIIFSVHGETLHNHYHGNKMHSGQLALNDSGAENAYGYAGDITRTYPVDPTFTPLQKDFYELVLEMEEKSIAALKPGVKYRDIHINSNRIMLEGMKSMGYLKGDVEDMLEQGVGGLFMPHGLGHMIGMDVHDMEDLGEEYVGYRDGLERSTMLGLRSLRLARELEEGFVITVEPGIYFIPDLIKKMRSEQKHADFVNYSKLEALYDFGGIRIEDDVLITENGHQILGDYIPKKVSEIEEIRG